MMKKSIYIYSIVMLLVLFHFSCSDYLDLSPKNEISAGNMWTTESLADKGMIGIYTLFYPTSLSSPQLSRADGINRQGIEAMGFPTDYYSNNYPVRLLSLSEKRAGDFQVSHEWRFCYTIIHACNDAIANLHKANLSTEKYERYQCEARFIRAWTYNRLNMLYQGVPIYLEPISNENTTRKQSSADKVWEVIIDDLTYCIDNPHLENNTLSQTGYGRPSKGAAYALRGMVYMWQEKYEDAVNDFDEVEKCGYGLWDGEYFEIFKWENEKSQEMIFTLQFDEETGWSDNIQRMTGARDTYNSWGEIKPSADFVDYYQNADGSTFKWNDVPGLEDWDLLTPEEREIFFCRNALERPDMARQKLVVIRRVGQDIYDNYYLNAGNESRIKQAYENRDPRLQQTVVAPYTPVDCYVAQYNSGITQRGKQLRWPLVDRGANGGDLWLDKRFSAFYLYRKYVEFDEGTIIYSDRGKTDWPLIRYTQIHLMKAEALAHLDEFDESIQLVNQIRRRAHMPELVYSGGAGPNNVLSKDDLLERIRYESRVELCVEAVNFFEEVRWGTYKESKFQGNDENGGKSWWGEITEYRWYYSDIMWPWSAPRVAIERNPNLEKREGWVY